MFKKLKDKIAEEVKSSPQRIQQIAQAAQAAVSSASSSTPDISGNDFFSITEEDTPQNSPLKKIGLRPSPLATNSHTNTSEVTLENLVNLPLNNGNLLHRSRKLSNSSIASDASFRLPSYDSPAVYHLQSDLDVSASEMEDTSVASNSLGMVSKEQLHQAYRKSLDRYTKYRVKYTELAKRYRDLERDNTKARSVLVETQDKALRRISELREQCSLEQQAKAHLESALRLEMDEMQCVIKTLTSKLKVVGENPDLVASSTEDTTNDTQDNLINLIEVSENINKVEAKTNDAAFESKDDTKQQNEIKILNEKIISLELLIKEQNDQLNEEKSKLIIKNEEVKSNEKSIKELAEKLTESNNKIKELQQREEENTILLAENKLMIHSELENKETEVKQLKENLTKLENDWKKSTSEKESLLEKFSTLKSQLNELNNNKESNAKLHDLENSIETLKTEKNNIESEKDILKEKIQSITKDKEMIENQMKQLNDELHLIKEEKNNNVVSLTATTNDLREQKTKYDFVAAELQQLKEIFDVNEKEKSSINDSNKKLKNEFANHKQQMEELNKTIKQLTADNELLINDKIKIDERLKSVFEEKKQVNNELKQIKDKLEKVNNKFKKLSEEKNTLNTQNEKFSNDIKALKDDISNLLHEKNVLNEELKSLNIVNQNSESEAIRTLKEAISTTTGQIEDVKRKCRDAENKLNEKTIECENLSETVLQLKREIEFNVIEIGQSKTKIESIKTEKRDLEKTLEKEIREKGELKIQVTNILQEIGRLEDQLKEVKQSYSEMQEEKANLEEKMEKLQKQNNDTKLKNEKENLQKLHNKIKELHTDNAQLNEKICLLEESNLQLINTLKDNEIEMETIKIENATINDNIKKLNTKLSECLDENSRLFNAKELMEHEYRSLQDQLEIKDKEKLCVLDTNKCLDDELKLIKTEKNNLNEKLKEFETLHEQQTNDINKFKKQLEHFNEIKIENEYNDKVIKELEIEIKILKSSENDLNKQVEVGILKLNDLTNFNDNLTQEISTLKSDCARMEEDLSNFKIENEKMMKELIEVKDENLKLNIVQEESVKLNQEVSGLKDENDRLNVIKQESIQLNQEIDRLKDENSKMNKAFNTAKEETDKLNKEINDLTDTANGLKDENVKWNTMVKTLKEENLKLTTTKDDTNKNLNDLMEENSKLKESLNDQRNENCKLLNSSDETSVNTKELNELKEKNNALMQQVNDDNQRLLNENNILKQELIDINISYNGKIKNLKQEIDELLDNEKLLKTNNNTDYDLLTKKNQELMNEIKHLRDKFLNDNNFNNNIDTIIKDKNDLEIKLNKIMLEVQDVSNRNLFLEQKCENYLILEQSNERLKLSNEKLSRQLDETLVSMHHNEGITANTEFEYLRNIMFQYLSGHVNGNNSTLIKVIAAVLKFSPQQTQVVIEKESQRNTLLGQLNNLL